MDIAYEHLKTWVEVFISRLLEIPFPPSDHGANTIEAHPTKDYNGTPPKAENEQHLETWGEAFVRQMLERSPRLSNPRVATPTEASNIGSSEAETDK